MYVTAEKRSAEVKEFDRFLHKLYSFADKVTQADIWRYIVIYKYGGVYADMDSICKMPLDYLIQTNWTGKEFLATGLDEWGFANNANFGACKNSTVMKLVLNNLVFRYKNIDIYEILLNSKSKHDFWDRIEKVLKTSWIEYSKVLTENTDLVSFDFLAAEHSEKFKTKFDYDFYVDNSEATELYSKLAAQNSWLTHIDPKEMKMWRLE
jgi:hypothetical protein